MIVKPLADIEFSVLIACFLKAFEGYFVSMPTDPQYYKTRWEAAKLRYDLSYGMFDGDKLVGFILHAVDTRNGYFTAFNTGTGVLPEYRGRKIVKFIYDDALKALKNNGVSRCTLEVIRENTLAIKAYKGVGFTICKNYKCFRGTIKTGGVDNARISLVTCPDLDWEQLPNQDRYSWDNHSRTIRNGTYQYYQVFVGENLEAYFIINPENGYVAQYDVLDRSPGNWERLFAAIQLISDEVIINNVDEDLVEKLHHTKAVGLTNTVDQYEMELIIV